MASYKNTIKKYTTDPVVFKMEKEVKVRWQTFILAEQH